MKKLILFLILTVLSLSVACSNDKAVDANNGELENVSENIENLVENTDDSEEAKVQVSEAETETETEIISETESEIVTEGEVEAEIKSVTESESESETITEGENEAESKLMTEGKVELVNEDKVEIITDSETAVFIETINIDPILSVNEEKIAIAFEQGVESPLSQIDRYQYTPKDSDVINFDPQISTVQLKDSLKHKGFDGLEVTYDKTGYKWNDFFGDLDYLQYSRNITVNLSGKSIYEADIVDDYQRYYRYFDENKGLYYEVNDFMVGNFLDENADLTNERTGNCCNYNGIEGIEAPTYNPLSLQNGEEAGSYFITMLDNKPCVYIETLLDDKFHKKWIDIEFGLLVKELVFDNEGLLLEKKVASSIIKKDIDDSVFIEAKDVEYKDITLFVFSITGGDMETIFEAVDNTIPTSETGILLRSDSGSEVTIYTSGMDDMKLDDEIYYSKVSLDSGEVRTIREILDNRFYTICDELEIVEIYDKSCNEKKFFNFEDVGLVSVKIVEDSKIYIFYDPNNISVSGLYDVYEYVIENGEFEEINYYQIENVTINEAIGDVITYNVSLIDFDENVYDDSCMDTYKIIDRGENSFDDGEYMPFWYE